MSNTENFVQLRTGVAFKPLAVASSGVVILAIDSEAAAGAVLELTDEVSLDGLALQESSADVQANSNVVCTSIEVVCRSGSATLVHESGSASATRRLHSPTSANVTVTPGQAVRLLYDPSMSRWTILGVVHSVNGQSGHVVITPTAPVQSVNGETGTVVLSAADVGADAAGTAAAEVAAHVAAANPHTQYTRSLRYSGTTAGSGTYSETFASAFSNTPNVQAVLVGGTAQQYALVTSRSTTGFTVTAYTRSVVSLLGIDVVAGSPTATNGLTVDVFVTSND